MKPIMCCYKKDSFKAKQTPERKKKKTNFGISTWTPTVELVDTCTRRKGCRAKADGGADTEVTFLQTQSNFCPTHTVLPGMHMHEHMRIHVDNTGSFKDLLWMKKHSDPLTRPKHQLAVNQSCVFKLRMFWIIDVRSLFFSISILVFSNF